MEFISSQNFLGFPRKLTTKYDTIILNINDRLKEEEDEINVRIINSLDIYKTNFE